MSRAAHPSPLSYARTRRNHRQERDAAVVARFTTLYQQQRMRLDDVMQQLATEFFLTPRTIGRILKQRPRNDSKQPSVAASHSTAN